MTYWEFIYLRRGGRWGSSVNTGIQLQRHTLVFQIKRKAFHCRIQFVALLQTIYLSRPHMLHSVHTNIVKLAQEHRLSYSNTDKNLCWESYLTHWINKRSGLCNIHSATGCYQLFPPPTLLIIVNKYIMNFMAAHVHIQQSYRGEGAAVKRLGHFSTCSNKKTYNYNNIHVLCCVYEIQFLMLRFNWLHSFYIF